MRKICILLLLAMPGVSASRSRLPRSATLVQSAPAALTNKPTELGSRLTLTPDAPLAPAVGYRLGVFEWRKGVVEALVPHYREFIGHVGCRGGTLANQRRKVSVAIDRRFNIAGLDRDVLLGFLNFRAGN